MPAGKEGSPFGWVAILAKLKASRSWGEESRVVESHESNYFTEMQLAPLQVCGNLWVQGLLVPDDEKQGAGSRLRK